jgi:two-component system, chemotaxis family, sensor kinase CheA
LCVDDEEEVLEIVSDMVQECGFEVLTAGNALDGMELIKLHHASLAMIISDAKMPETNGIEFRKMMLDDFRDIPFAILSAYISKDLALQGVEYKICAFLEKPSQVKQILELIEREATQRMNDILEDREIADIFIEEAVAIMGELEPLILGLENAPDDMDAVNTIFRLLHTIKGGSTVINRPIITNFIHHYEDIFAKIKKNELVIDNTIIDVLLASFDQLGAIVSSLEQRDGQIFTAEEIEKCLVTSEKSAKKKVRATSTSIAKKPKKKAQDSVTVIYGYLGCCH